MGAGVVVAAAQARAAAGGRVDRAHAVEEARRRRGRRRRQHQTPGARVQPQRVEEAFGGRRPRRPRRLGGPPVGHVGLGAQHGPPGAGHVARRLGRTLAKRAAPAHVVGRRPRPGLTRAAVARRVAAGRPARGRGRQVRQALVRGLDTVPRCDEPAQLQLQAAILAHRALAEGPPLRRARLGQGSGPHGRRRGPQRRGPLQRCRRWRRPQALDQLVGRRGPRVEGPAHGDRFHPAAQALAAVQ
uniref:Uncharacterized protein n=1 Tax=Ixodes ricinus TaxID=34613 RepID=A0A6B0V4J2_IXORI